MLAGHLANALEAIQLLITENTALRSRINVCETRIGIKPIAVIPEAAQKRLVQFERRWLPAIGDLRSA